MEALKWLSTNENIVIKRDDNGGAVIEVWRRDMYVPEAMRQLGYHEHHQPLLCNPAEQIKTELTEILL